LIPSIVEPAGIAKPRPFGPVLNFFETPSAERVAPESFGDPAARDGFVQAFPEPVSVCVVG